MPSRPDGVVSENATLTAHEIPLRLLSARLRVAAQVKVPFDPGTGSGCRLEGG
jgi:hypothetical protein